MRALLGALTSNYSASDQLIEYRVKRAADPDVMAAYRATMGWVREHGLTFSTEAIAGIRVPTMVIHGRHDEVVPLDTAMEVVRAIPDASLAVAGHCGHLVMLEDVEFFCDLVTSYWRKISRHRAVS